MKTATGILFVAFYVLLTFCACKEDGMAGVETLASVKEVSIPNVGKVNEAFSIDLIMFGTSRGSEFSWFESSSQADTTTFELYQWRDKGLMCATSIIEINVAIDLTFHSPGIKYLGFNMGTNEQLIRHHSDR